ncbi:MAG: hypothetical protein QGH25_09760 [Candidatus Latescibacteria bacterium]|nr:hypothetical protein [Candidatus Latescibacterota bacterium]
MSVLTSEAQCVDSDRIRSASQPLHERLDDVRDTARLEAESAALDERAHSPRYLQHAVALSSA